MTGAWLVLGFVLGVLADQNNPLESLVLLLSLVASSWLLGRHGWHLVRMASVLVLGLVLGVVRYHVLLVPSTLGTSTSGVVLTVADGNSETSEVVILRDDGQLVGLTVDDPTAVEVGQRVVWQGVYHPGRSTVAGIGVVGQYEIEAFEAEQERAFWPLLALRRWVRDAVLRVVPEPSGSLTLGILTGDDRGLAASTRDVLRRSGLSHVTAVSGWNVAVVTAVVEGVVARLSPWVWLRWVGIGTAVWGYAVLTGLEPPVQRAAAMATLYLLARWRGWPREPISALGWAVVGLLLVRPELAYSLAFQLSAIATFTLSAMRLGETKERQWKEFLLVPVAVQLAVTPLLLLRLGTFSLVAPLANALVEPVMPWLLVAGLLALLAALMGSLGTVLAIPAWALGRWIVLVAEWLLRIPGVSGVMIEPPVWIVVWLYVLAAGLWLAWIDRGRSDT
ncbi:ComEC/Rec2 family competence protein [Thermomicrobium sp. CFH 73360]|uniref:ComEC/Rec2 family competence protein n=1 Tax=Thermomicrobium sp. CFH 73360 TaxID=2951987 RepID=UPI0020775E2A|nr:ComEC/Rec2 family competence protein [Thermomicrobium sp. CFH 73360]MCM8747097.1 ComEC/Rec2 family competence protein [Thermomicrobium sp. CFH 73360]